MPRVKPVTGKGDVPAQHHAVVDDVQLQSKPAED